MNGLALALLALLQPAERPNVLLITLDTVRADHLGSYGSSLGATPHLDRLASEGLRYDQAISPVPLTRPAHTSLFTGLYPNEHGVRDNLPLALDPSLETIAERLRDVGYRTGGFVGSFLLGRGSGLEAGFEVFSDGAGSDGTGDRVGASAERSASAVAEDARRFLSAVEPPFFAWVHFYDPHAPYEPPEPVAERFDSNRYAGEIAYVDAAVGSLLQLLRDRGLDRDTLVIVTADHGEGLGDHGEDEHGVFVYEESIRVPLMLRYPGRIAPSVSMRPVSLIDVAPTILEAAGIPPEAGKGVSLLGEPRPRPIYFESLYGSLHFGWAPLAGVRRESLKLIYAPRAELYDLDADPRETRNVANERRADARRLFAELETFQARPMAARPERSGADLEKLASLGYVATPTRGETGADPKDEIARFSDFGTKLRSAIESFHAGDCKSAVPVLSELAERDILSFEVHLYLARCHRLLGEPEKALTEYEAALAIYDDYAALHLEHGLLLLQTGALPSAAAAFEKSLAIAPTKQAALGLAGSRRRLGQLPSAVEALERALELDEDDGDSWNELGAVYMMMEDEASALSAFRHAVKLRPDDEMFRHNLIRALSETTVGVLRFADAASAASARERLLAGETFDAVAGGTSAFTLAGADLSPELVASLMATEHPVTDVVQIGDHFVLAAVLP